MKLFKIIHAIFIYIFIGATFAMAYGLNKHYPTWLRAILILGSLSTLSLVSEHFKSKNLKLFGKIDITSIGSIAFICSGILIFQLFYL